MLKESQHSMDSEKEIDPDFYIEGEKVSDDTALIEIHLLRKVKFTELQKIIFDVTSKYMEEHKDG